MREAVRAGLITFGEAAGVSSDLELRSLAAHTEDSAFYAAALDHIVKRSGASGGFLYVAARERLRCVARTVGILGPDAGRIDRLAHEYYARSCTESHEDLEAPTKLATMSASTAQSDEFTLWPCALARTTGERRAIEGIVVFVSNSASGAGVSSSSLEDLASLLTQSSAATALEGDDASTTQ
jgi:hypothetical protein